MGETKKVYVYTGSPFWGWIWFAFHVCTAIIGHHIHGSFWWALFDWIFAPLVWVKWLICHEVNVSIIREAFDFFLK